MNDGNKGGILKRLGGPLRVAASILTFLFSYTAQSATYQVQVALSGDSHFIPRYLTIHAGDTVQWVWADNNDHSVVSGDGNTGQADGIFNSGVHRAPFTYSHTFPTVGSFPYFCGVHYPLNHGGTWPAITVTAAEPTTQLSLLPGDFNRDGFSDYLLFSPTSRKTAVWYLRNGAIISGSYGPTLPPGWAVIALADFDHNGTPDYVLYNATTRQSAVWFLNNATFVSGSMGPTLPTGWKLIAANDLNGDGKPDYVLFNLTTRQSAVWYLNGTTYSTGAFGPALPAGWTLIDVRDFNANNQPDYLILNPSTRETAVWYLSGTAFVNGAFGPRLAAGWTLQSAADFNADGKPDYVLFDPSTRRTAIWYLNGTTFVTGAFGPTLPATF